MSIEIQHYAAALTGSLFQEVLHWYEARGKLEAPEYQALMKSPAYWVIAGLMIVLCAVGCVFWYDSAKVSSRDYLVTSAAFGAIFKQAVSGAQNNRKRKLGEAPEGFRAIKAYFSL
jgi:hypothetical protein